MQAKEKNACKIKFIDAQSIGSKRSEVNDRILFLRVE
jgi:hypothetical protein